MAWPHLITPLAAHDGNLVPLFIAGVILLVKFVSSFGKGKDEDDIKPPSTSLRVGDPPRGEGNEESERARRFLEAIGVGSGTSPAQMAQKEREKRERAEQRRKEAEALRAKQQRELLEENRQRREAASRARTVTPPAPRHTAPPRRPPPMPSLDSAPAPSKRAADISLAPLEAPTFAGFTTKSSEVTAIPFERAAPPTRTAQTGQDAISAATDSMAAGAKKRSVSALHALLRQPGALRTALLLREILGPPRGLPSAAQGSSFPSP